MWLIGVLVLLGPNEARLSVRHIMGVKLDGILALSLVKNLSLSVAWLSRLPAPFHLFWIVILLPFALRGSGD